MCSVHIHESSWLYSGAKFCEVVIIVKHTTKTFTLFKTLKLNSV